MSRALEGKTALVTGGSRALGRAIAQDLAELGTIVAISYASNDRAARETLESIETKGGQALLIKARQGSCVEAMEQLRVKSVWLSQEEVAVT
jgi:3-oxoacyl-[acyl-carrier protein] reductase